MAVCVGRTNPCNLAFLSYQVGSPRSTAALPPPSFHLSLPSFANINMASGDDDDPIIEEVCPQAGNVARIVQA